MGGGRYTYEAFSRLKVSKSYDHKSREEIFTARNIDPEMDPKTIKIRESRDSEEHPESLSIIIGLDVTGSMGFVPEDIVRNTLPDLMGSLIEAGIKHPQVLFLGIGDFVYDEAPLQVGQFESSAELLDRWLTKVYLEGGGGGNNKEGYNFAYLFAARHTVIDCWEKRKQKGFLFTIGDEPVYSEIPADIITRYTVATEARKVSTEALIKEVSERYEIFHLHLEHDAWSKEEERKGNWKSLLGERLVIIPDYKRVAKRIAELVIQHVHAASAKGLTARNDTEDML
ncbi:hypothetical protein GCM10023231_13180 [Olivibacter ginsenosidimutans]|uniref:VWA domain-containing protein n=1 Tax=Olivibacter ginsenosidimutans TaxID=1176537 RepID=A0ABP9AVD1_9SPHI